MSVTRFSDMYSPLPFNETVSKEDTYALQLVAAGVAEEDGRIPALLNQGGAVYDMPSFGDFDTTAAQIATDDTTVATPMKVGHETEKGVRLIRTASWSASAISAILSGSDPMGEMASKVGRFWAYQKQSAILGLLKGVLADNTANDAADYTVDLSTLNSSTYADGVTNFSAGAMIDTAQLMGDNADKLVALFCHSAVYARMLKNNLIDVQHDSDLGPIRRFHDKVVFVDDRMPNPSSGVYETFLFGRGFLRYGSVAHPEGESELWRDPMSGTGSGQSTLITRRIWSFHPTGHAYTGTSPVGGPGDGTGSNNLATAGSWNRVYSDRKKIRFARLITRES